MEGHTHRSYGKIAPSMLEPTGDEVQDALDDGECPWCDEYDGEHPEAHASRAHAEEWNEYKGE